MCVLSTVFSIQMAWTTFTIMYITLCHISMHIPYHKIDAISNGKRLIDQICSFDRRKGLNRLDWMKQSGQMD